MKRYWNNLSSYVRRHKIISTIIVIVILGAGYGVYAKIAGNAATTKYVLGRVEKGTLVRSISGTGQVSAVKQIDIKSKVSGDVVYVNNAVGKPVQAGTLLVQLDASDAAYALESAKISYDKLVTVDPDDLRNAENDVEKSQDDLKSSYVSALSTLSSVSTNMTDVVDDIETLFDGYLNPRGESNFTNAEKEYIQKANSSWYDARNALQEFSAKYKTILDQSSAPVIESILDDLYKTSLIVSQAAKYTQDAVIYHKDKGSGGQIGADDAYTTVNAAVSTANSAMASALSSKNTITNDKKAVETAERALQKIKDGPDTLDLRAEHLSVQQKQTDVADYYTRAPFAGIVASLDVVKGDTVSSNAVLGTLITQQKIAELSLNEVDAALVKVGQKATLTFDAFDTVEIPGQVVEIDLIGTVSQGVVTYNVKIAFDTEDARIKPGMSVSASIVTDSKADTLIVPSSAVKSNARGSYVEVLDGVAALGNNQSRSAASAGIESTVPPRAVPVKIGLSNDTEVEIVSGLSEGDSIVIRTTTGTSAQTAATPPQRGLFGGGGGVRVPR